MYKRGFRDALLVVVFIIFIIYISIDEFGFKYTDDVYKVICRRYGETIYSEIIFPDYKLIDNGIIVKKYPEGDEITLIGRCYIEKYE